MLPVSRHHLAALLTLYGGGIGDGSYSLYSLYTFGSPELADGVSKGIRESNPC